MKLIFLDIDGVLLPLPYREDVKAMPVAKELRLRLEANPDTAGHLCTIARLGDAKIVVSSTWRIMMPFNRLKKAFKNTIEIIGVTSDGLRGRGTQIRQYLAEHPAEKFVILDDDDFDMGDLLPQVVKTDSSTGLTAKDVEAAIKLLS